MCGISGWISFGRPPDVQTVQRMNQRLEHRGPDAGAAIAMESAALGHRRLSVIDLSPEANQPMTDETEMFWIVYNGEVYNFGDLRNELETLGARFRTRSDTEVILEAYKAWGAECLCRFNGMFAFAIWDRRERTLFMARDRAGEKPLFWMMLDDGGLVFASETKALRAHPDMDATLNPRAVSTYFSLNHVLGSGSIFQSIQSVSPGCYAVFDGSSPPVEHSYWDLAVSFDQNRTVKSEDEACEELSALIDDAVRIRLISDVPLGTFLSGGIDSSTIASAASRIGPFPHHTFSIGFKEATYSETAEARSVAEHLGTHHHERTVETEIAAAFERMVYYGDMPFADTSFLPTFQLAQFAREDVTVALSGDGGDELFCGYETYAADKIKSMLTWVPKWAFRLGHGAASRLLPVSFGKVSFDYKARKFLQGATLEPAQAHHHWRSIFSRKEKMALLPQLMRNQSGDDSSEEFAHYWHTLRQCGMLDRGMYTDIKTWLSDNILVKVDRASMAQSLEVRAPLLDYRIIEFAASLPEHLKMKGWQKKYILKKCLQDRLPDWVLNRKKQGFNAPVSHWLTGRLSGLARAATSEPALLEWVEPAYVNRLWEDHEAKRADHGLKLFGLSVFGVWLRQVKNSETFTPHIQAANPALLDAPAPL